MYICIYVYIYIYVYMYICIHIQHLIVISQKCHRSGVRLIIRISFRSGLTEEIRLKIFGSPDYTCNQGTPVYSLP